jgi:alcohol dehydrogenase
MREILFRLPTEIHAGPGISHDVAVHAASLGGSRVLLVTDPGLVSVGIPGEIAQHLTAAGFEVAIFDGVSPNPRDHECAAAATMAREEGSNLIVAVGGGSPIDLAKAAAGLATNEGSAVEWAAPRSFVNEPLPLLAIPTTAGTGSEVTRSSVINDTARNIKFTIRDLRIAPKIALVDADLTSSLPPAITAATGMDALTHAIEAYTCRLASPITDALALHAIRLIAEHLTTAVRDGGNRTAREEMMMASVIAGMAFSNSDVASVHCIAEAIGGRYDTPHGVANSLFLPYLFAHNVEAAPRRHAEVALALGAADPGMSDGEAADAGAKALSSMAREIGIPRFSELPGIDLDDFPWIAAASVANLSNASNAREMTESDYQMVLDRAWSA